MIANGVGHAVRARLDRLCRTFRCPGAAAVERDCTSAAIPRRGLGIPTGVPLPVLLGLLDDPRMAESAARNPQITNELARGLISRAW
jgi:hypothetical protein